ncbi:MAG TPA: hypothetical protein VHS31_19635 [Tepidisphaeraceae bacterium]|jgi:hypothetical protein|nr:hypothetical protein [Tepidisphaeraceae bacterium]
MRVLDSVLENAISGLKEGALEIDCAEIILIQGTLKNPRIYRGPGIIRQKSDRQLWVTMFVENMTGASLSTEGAAGEIIPRNQLYRLTAKDITGRYWKSRSVYLVAKPGSSLVLSGRLYELHHLSDRFLSGQLELIIFDDFPIPWNRESKIRESTISGARAMRGGAQGVKFSCPDFSVVVTKAESEVSIEANPRHGNQRLPYRIDNRLIETLQFIVARPIAWSVRLKYRRNFLHVTLRTPAPAGTGVHLHPPIRLLQIPMRGDIWRLFRRFLIHILNYPQRDMHPISKTVYGICEASRGTIDATGLALAVGIEAVVKDEFATFGEPTPRTQRALASLAIHLESWRGPKKLKARLSGLLKMIESPSTKDRLFSLISKHAVTKQQIRDWQELRNRMAHGTRFGAADTARLLKACDKATVLLYHLIFRAIGYRGIYTDYGTREWPNRHYPSK